MDTSSSRAAGTECGVTRIACNSERHQWPTFAWPPALARGRRSHRASILRPILEVASYSAPTSAFERRAENNFQIDPDDLARDHAEDKAHRLTNPQPSGASPASNLLQIGEIAATVGAHVWSMKSISTWSTTNPPVLLPSWRSIRSHQQLTKAYG